jgi:hypothetical protein
MADQKFNVVCRGVDKSHHITVEASEVIGEGSHWRITGSKGTLWVSKEAFIYAMPSTMFPEK